MEYRSIPRISNSDLTEFRNFLFGRSEKIPVKAFAFGTALHEMILEPGKGGTNPPFVDLELVNKLARVAREDKFLKWILQFSSKEEVRLWQDTETGLTLKSRLDIVYKNRLVVDIKSTSCRTREDFVASCLKYDYDRQAAFYLDSLGAEEGVGRRFAFVAIQKVKPFNVWRIEYSGGSDFIEQGRHREFLGLPFVPMTWKPGLFPNDEESPSTLAA
ncbi:PD-(D/E)XK nuclease-like domain-containing protein [Salmonirosea aquatica]|uniref:Putative exodeoxyribonuclease 8 PDDEXK-like domain-containing protein n=1 Tax=Salmonirosea aquatica TaxID=2654236 RepID=A0A7C9FAL4_9BACT|nr:hypothetical protein [Cytophagaceae bacterium SJW1-29]